MKKLLLLTLLLIGNYSFSQENLEEISREREKLEDLARSTYFEKGGKLLFYDIFNQADRWEIKGNMTADELRDYIKDLEQVKAKWEAPNGPLQLALSRVDNFHAYNNKMCSTYGVVGVVDYCKIRDDYKKKYPRKSLAYENAIGHWQRKYDFAKQLLEEKSKNPISNTSNQSNNNSTSNNNNSSNSTSNSNNSNSSERDNSSNTSTSNNSSTTETYAERLQRQERERKEHAQKLAREHQEWANKQQADRIAMEKAGEEIGEGIVAIGEMINIKEADFSSNRLVLNYTLNKFNEINFGYSHRSVWGKFFWQIDFMASALYFKGWKEKQKINRTEDSSSYNSELNELRDNIEEEDLLSTWQYVNNYTSSGTNYSTIYYGANLYSKENIFSIGGGLNTGFGFYIPTKFNGDFVINALGHISMRTNQMLSYGYKFGIEYQLEKIGFGLHYKNSSYSTNDKTIIISADESKFSESQRYDSELNQINYFRTNTKPDDFNEIIKTSNIELSIFILL